MSNQPILQGPSWDTRYIVWGAVNAVMAIPISIVLIVNATQSNCSQFSTFLLVQLVVVVFNALFAAYFAKPNPGSKVTFAVSVQGLGTTEGSPLLVDGEKDEQVDKGKWRPVMITAYALMTLFSFSWYLWGIILVSNNSSCQNTAHSLYFMSLAYIICFTSYIVLCCSYEVFFFFFLLRYLKDNGWNFMVSEDHNLRGKWHFGQDASNPYKGQGGGGGGGGGHGHTCNHNHSHAHSHSHSQSSQPTSSENMWSSTESSGPGHTRPQRFLSQAQAFPSDFDEESGKRA